MTNLESTSFNLLYENVLHAKDSKGYETPERLGRSGVAEACRQLLLADLLCKLLLPQIKVGREGRESQPCLQFSFAINTDTNKDCQLLSVRVLPPFMIT